jgi:energy-converting hydrogenase Eha subunit E
MTRTQIDEVLQWTGAAAIIAGHVLNAVGPAVYPYNIAVFAVGTVAFLAWAIRVANKPQAVVNIVALAIGLVGLYNAIG